ncbi:hypothetical protein BN946_scf184799.g17 [Trametes cinnabarina]|uniref:Chromo domain-containing protein n=1 Tax=Pycnoporus cinnabarinus TaxID=5643 RepID=A0A060S213_PYCCI|nr:hypothetical protein BN946_scf184799.g17 [Trametes cinnabarina]
MSENEAEYVVESIVRAKVAAKRGKKYWLYSVKWKDYGLDENTWEPVESFAGGSEHFISAFWDRVNTNGRDYRDLRQFSVNEELFPTGPPRRKKIKKAQVDAQIPPSPPAEEPVDSENEVRSIINDDEEVEEPATTSRRKRRRSSAANLATENPSPPKRKRGRPPGKRPEEVEQEEAVQTLSHRWSVPDLPRTNRGRQITTAETSELPARRLSLPRRRNMAPKNPQPSTSSPDEIDLLSDTSEKPRSSRGLKGVPEVLLETSYGSRPGSSSMGGRSAQGAAMMDVDQSEEEHASFGSPTLLSPRSDPEPPSGTPSFTAMPPHRSRAANPRVQLLDDPNLAEAGGALSVKAKFMKRTVAENGHNVQSLATPPNRVSKGKAGPGRSSGGLIVGGSRLVAHKGKLTTIKANAAFTSFRALEEGGSGTFGDMLKNAAEADEVPGLGRFDQESHDARVPTAKELLKAAGLDSAAAEGLPDFEEDAEGEDDLEYLDNAGRSQAAPEQDHAPKQNGALEKNIANEGSAEPAATEDKADKPSCSPSVPLVARPLTFASRVTSAFSQSTIFGPLPQGKQEQDQYASSSSAPKQHTFNLNVDPAVSIPVVIREARAPASFLDNLDNVARNPTGKFYKDQYASALLDTLRPQGSYTKLTLNEGATEEQKRHFSRFVGRLRANELFIQMNRFEPLVMCDCANSALVEKLGIPTSLLGTSDSVILAHVSIENHSAYAEAALHADNSRW